MELPQPPPPQVGPVQLSKLVHDSAQNAYRELHGLIDSLPDKASLERKEAILDFAQRTRHRMLRTLAVVRWAMDYAAVIDRGAQATVLAHQRALTYSNAADGLFEVRNVAVGAESEEKLVGVSSEVLVASELDRLPKICVRSIEIPEPLSGGEEGAIVRLGEVTRSALRECLLQTSGVKVLRWRVENPAFASRIGVGGAWHADVSLDRLDAESAHVRIYNLQVSVRSDTIAREGQGHADSMNMTRRQEQLLVRVCNDRIYLAATKWESEDSKSKAKEEGEGPCRFGSLKKMIEAVRDFVGPEVCAPLAMEHLYRQAGELSRGHLAEVFKCNALKKNKPIVVQYWRQHRRAAQLTVNATEQVIYNGTNHTIENREATSHFITARHHPELETTIARTVQPLAMNALNLERYLLSIMRARALSIFKQLYEKIARDKELDCTVRMNTDHCLSLAVGAKFLNGGVELRMDQARGFFRARLFGDAATLTDDFRFEVHSLEMRSISKYFKTDDEEYAAVKSLLSQSLDLLKIVYRVYIFRASEVGASPVGPPGVTWKKAKPPFDIRPPFAPIEVKRPRSFASLMVAPAKSVPRITAPLLQQSDVYILAKSNLDDVVSIKTVHNWIEMARCHFLARRLHRFFRMERLLPKDAAEWTPVPDKAGRYVNIGLTTSGLCVTSSVLILNVRGSWQIKLTTSQNIFDRQWSTRLWSPTRYVTYTNATLRFGYPVIEAEAVRTFSRELKCARTMATFGHQLPKVTASYQLKVRTPRKLLFVINDPIRTPGASSASRSLSDGRNNTGAGPMGSPNPTSNSGGSSGNSHSQNHFSHRIIVELGPFPRLGFRVGIYPAKEAMSALAPLIEEVLDAAREEVGIALAGTLERSCPTGAVVERVLLSKMRGHVTWLSVVQMRLRFSGTGLTEGQNFDFDVDLRRGDCIVLNDLARYAEVHGRRLNPARARVPPDAWNAASAPLLEGPSPRAQRQAERDWCIVVKLTAFEEFLKLLVAGMIGDNHGTVS